MPGNLLQAGNIVATTRHGPRRWGADIFRQEQDKIETIH